MAATICTPCIRQSPAQLVRLRHRVWVCIAQPSLWTHNHGVDAQPRSASPPDSPLNSRAKHHSPSRWGDALAGCNACDLTRWTLVAVAIGYLQAVGHRRHRLAPPDLDRPSLPHATGKCTNMPQNSTLRRRAQNALHTTLGGGQKVVRRALCYGGDGASGCFFAMCCRRVLPMHDASARMVVISAHVHLPRRRCCSDV